MSNIDKQAIDKLIASPSYIPLYHKDFPLILLWTPKSGCTTYNKWFFFQIGLFEKVHQEAEGEVHRYRDFIFRKEPDYTQGLTKNLLDAKKDIHKLVRNPYKRAVSSFLHTICSEWLICKFDSDIYKGLSFKQFLIHLKSLGPTINTIDRHIAPQYIDGEEQFITEYIQLENFNNHITEIEKTYGLLKSPFSQISKSSHHFSERMVQKGEYAEAILTVEKSAGRFPTYESFYNKESKELVKEIFAKDFEIYGYDKDNIII
ncbi:sulfotransferase family 2 domain-containing protein [Peribacillus simplex]|uniref:sulfotransferase family protein n=1 Tax=Peribacillus TaxID=2675229 RepID=UPI0021617F16|nr:MULTISPECIES: sulfotransferase family protein [Peribacillus]MBX9957266.1 sulfotransferase family 2 domain-containing protein [Peribacillus simplex]